jgi:hypothetical protein
MSQVGLQVIRPRLCSIARGVIGGQCGNRLLAPRNHLLLILHSNPQQSTRWVIEDRVRFGAMTLITKHAHIVQSLPDHRRDIEFVGCTIRERIMP